MLAQQNYEPFDSLLALPPPFNMVVLIVVICVGAGIVTTISRHIRDFAIHRQDVTLKRELVDRGFTAEEIEQVVRSQSVDLASLPSDE